MDVREFTLHTNLFMAELAQGSFYLTATIASVAANSGLVRNRPCATPQRIRLEKRSALLSRADNCRLCRITWMLGGLGTILAVFILGLSDQATAWVCQNSRARFDCRSRIHQPAGRIPCDVISRCLWFASAKQTQRKSVNLKGPYWQFQKKGDS